MRRWLCLLSLVSAASVVAGAGDSSNDAAWGGFKAAHNKTYASSEEEAYRRVVFDYNLQHARELAAGSRTGASFGVTAFADMTATEMRATRAGVKVPPAVAQRVYARGYGAANNGTAVPRVTIDAATSKDWRKEHVITPVKDQGSCGSCYAFAVTGSIEAHNAIAKKGLVSLSEQEIISCDKSSDGCGGGWPEHGYQWLIKNRFGKAATEQAYPYASYQTEVPSCNVLSIFLPSGGAISTWKQIPSDERAMAEYVVAHGPVAVVVDSSAWRLYKGGIMDNCASKYLDHAVVIVGVTPEFWILKNSWGPAWGEAGYIRLQFGTNQCMITSHVVAPIV